MLSHPSTKRRENEGKKRYIKEDMRINEIENDETIGH